MRKIFFILFCIPFLTLAQIDKTIKLKVTVMQNFVHKDSLGETAFWQTKGKITFGIVNYTAEQNPIFKQLFINQYQELLKIYKVMIVSENEKDTALYVKTLIRQEDDYRNLLTKEQLKAYSNKLLELKSKNLELFDSYCSLFFPDELLAEYKLKFSYTK